jgi:CTP synthase
MSAGQQLHHRADLRDVIRKERRGDYLGRTVQVIPHITDEIKGRGSYGSPTTPRSPSSRSAAPSATSSRLPFLEAIRQMRVEVGPQNASAFMH